MFARNLEDPNTDKANADNHSNQMNPNNDAYRQARVVLDATTALRSHRLPFRARAIDVA